MGTQAWLSVESTRHAVRIARRSEDVYTTSKKTPSARSSFPASRASTMPFSDRSTSIQPVNRLARFHSLCPWRRITSRPGVAARSSRTAVAADGVGTFRLLTRDPGASARRSGVARREVG